MAGSRRSWDWEWETPKAATLLVTGAKNKVIQHDFVTIMIFY